MQRLKPITFFIPLSLLLFSVVYSILDTEGFLSSVRSANSWILSTFGWLFSFSTFFFLLLCGVIYFSPIHKVRIGGPSAVPILTKWRWFSITLCTTIAIGILFWATAEPLYHLYDPPGGPGITPGTKPAAVFSLSTMFMHWSFTPYGTYTLAGLMFALVYYNLKQPFSLGSLFFPLFKRSFSARTNQVIDAICLYSLVAGMAASLGAGILTISGGIRRILPVSDSGWLLGLITIALVGTFVISSVSGLQKGIRILSGINVRGFFILAIFILLTGPTFFIFSFGFEGIVSYGKTFFSRSFGLGLEAAWTQSWTVFYWANWLAWTPVTAVFLGRIAKGYTVREFIHYNLVFPALFAIVWMMIFSGTTLHFDYFTDPQSLKSVLDTNGPEGVIYGLLDKLPFAAITSIMFLFLAFISYVTAADSNTTAMSGICSTGISPDSPSPPTWIKIVWGFVVGMIAWVMVTFAGIDGVKMASNLGGFPALFLVLAVAFGMIALIRNPKILE